MAIFNLPMMFFFSLWEVDILLPKAVNMVTECPPRLCHAMLDDSPSEARSGQISNYVSSFFWKYSKDDWCHFTNGMFARLIQLWATDWNGVDSQWYPGNGTSKFNINQIVISVADLSIGTFAGLRSFVLLYHKVCINLKWNDSLVKTAKKGNARSFIHFVFKYPRWRKGASISDDLICVQSYTVKFLQINWRSTDHI